MFDAPPLVDLDRQLLSRPAIIRPIEQKLLRPGYLPADLVQARQVLRQLVADRVLTKWQARRAIVILAPVIAIYDPLAGLAAPPGGATPVVAGTNATNDIFFGEDDPVNLPATIAAGNLLLIIICADGGSVGIPVLTTPGGWQLLGSDGIIGNPAVGSGAPVMYVFYRVANGGEGATVTIAADQVDAEGCAISYRITGHNTSTPLAVGFATDDSAEGTTVVDHPSLNPGFSGDANILWLASTFIVGSDSTWTVPTNYGNSIAADVTDISQDNRLESCRRALAAMSEDPGPYTDITNTGGSVASTIAVIPAES